MAKSKGLQISEDLTLPLDAVTSTVVVYGGKGMGKTNLGGVHVEELSAAHQRWSVIDPMGVWWGMRHSADGKGNGVECLILGGAHGDIPIEPTGGAVVADLVADERVNVIIDISRKANGEMWSIGERIRFVRDYGKQLFRRQGSLIDGKRREPLCQVIDEAARFLPQKISHGEEDIAQCMSIWRAIVEEGRNVGIGVVLLTQRSARLNKDVAELADMMLAFRTIGPNSLNAVMDWLSEHVDKKELTNLRAEVRSLPVGSCLAVSPGWLGAEKVIRIRMRHTFDSSATPKPGQQAALVKGSGAKPDLGVYAERMKETIERAKEDDPRALKARIRELEAAGKKSHVVSVQVDTKAASATLERIRFKHDELARENKSLQLKLDDRQRKANKLVHFISKSLKPVVEALEKVLEEFRAEAPVAPIAEVLTLPTPPAPGPTRVFPAHRVMPSKPATFDGEAKPLTGTALKIAGIVAGYGQRGQGIDKKLLATLCGNTMGGTFSARISEARTAGAIVTEGSMIEATAEGIAQYAGSFHAPETTEEVLTLWRPRLSGVSLKIFDHLVSLGGESISRVDLATAVGSTMGGTFSARLSEARSTQLLVESGGNVAVNRELLLM